MNALLHPRHRWRSLKMVAAEAGISEDLAADLLRADPEVRFGSSQTLGIKVGLRSKVG
jgi:hypothetical protein